MAFSTVNTMGQLINRSIGSPINLIIDGTLGTYTPISTYTDPNTGIKYSILVVTEGTVRITPSKTINIGYIVVSGGGAGGTLYGGSGGGVIAGTLIGGPTTLSGNSQYTLVIGNGAQIN